MALDPQSNYIIPLGEMAITMDPDVKKILELIVVNVAPEKRLAVAIAVRELAEPLWKSYARPPDPYDPTSIFRSIYLRRRETV